MGHCETGWDNSSLLDWIAIWQSGFGIWHSPFSPRVQ